MRACVRLIAPPIKLNLWAKNTATGDVARAARVASAMPELASLICCIMSSRLLWLIELHCVTIFEWILFKDGGSTYPVVGVEAPTAFMNFMNFVSKDCNQIDCMPRWIGA